MGEVEAEATVAKMVAELEVRAEEREEMAAKEVDGDEDPQQW